MSSVWVVFIGRCTVRMWGDSCRKSRAGHQTELVSAAYPTIICIISSNSPHHRRNRKLIYTHVIRAAALDCRPPNVVVVRVVNIIVGPVGRGVGSCRLEHGREQEERAADQDSEPELEKSRAEK
jgi:hypothetical protein